MTTYAIYARKAGRITITVLERMAWVACTVWMIAGGLTLFSAGYYIIQSIDRLDTEPAMRVPVLLLTAFAIVIGFLLFLYGLERGLGSLRRGLPESGGRESKNQQVNNG